MQLPKDELKEMLGMGISRRTMLKRMGYGAAGVALAPTIIEEVMAQKRPKLGSSLSDFTPQPVWGYTPPSTYNLGNYPVFSNGTMIIIASQLDPYDNGFQGIIYSLDSQTKEIRWSYSYPEINFLTPLIADGVIYVGDNAGSLYSIDSTTGTILWQKSYQLTFNNPLLAGGKLIFPTQDGYIYAVDLQGNQVWSYFSGGAVGQNGAETAVVSGGVVMAMMNNTLHAIDLQVGSFKWKYSDAGTVDSQLSVGNGNVYFTSQFTTTSNTSGDYLQALDVASGQLRWQWPSQFNVSGFSTPVYYNGAVYVGDGGGRFYAVDAIAGTLQWQTTVQGSLTASTILIEDGIAYFAADFSPTSDTSTTPLYAVDLPSKGQETVSFTPPNGALLAAVETGVCYYASFNPYAVGAVNLAGLVHQFFCESELMVEDYQTSAGTQGYQGNSTSFRTHVQLFDPNKNPRVNKSVKVWASGPVTITSGGQSYDIDAASTGKSAWLQTDAVGELSIVSTAASITSPALYLWGNFMELGEAIVIYPDHDTFNKLSGVQGTDLSQSKAYDGTDLLPSTYTAQQTSDLASTIRNTIGGTQAALAQTQQNHLAKKKPKKPKKTKPHQLGSAAPSLTAASYVAYPGSTTNLLYQPVAGPSDRTYVPGSVPTWTAKFDSAGGVAFSSGVTSKLKLPPPGSFWNSFDDFVNDVVNGARQIAQIIWDEAQTIYDDLGNAYQFVVQTVEHAAAVVAGILKTVVNDIEKAIQWLSYLFDWDDILSIHTQLQTTARQGFTNLKTWLNNQIASDLSTVHGFFQGLESTIQTNLAQATTAVGGSSLQSKQQNGNNPQTVYGAGGAKSYTKSRWMTEKLKDNAAKATVGSSLSLPTDTTDPILSAVQELITGIGTTISNSTQFNSIPDDLKNVFSDFSLLATNPSEFVTKSFSDIIQLISDIVVSLLQLVDAVVESLIKTLVGIIDAVIDLLSLPINIPVLTPLYSLITEGSQLSILDLCCLVVAVPTTIVQKALSSGAARSLTEPSDARSSVGAVVLNQNIGYIFAAACYVVLDPLMDAFDPPTPMRYVYGALSLLLQGLNFPTDLASNTAGTYVFYAAQAIPIIMTAVDIRAGYDAAFKVTWQFLASTIDVFYGFAMLGASLVLGMTDTQFQGKDYLLMFQNIFSSIPYIFKPLGLGGEQSKIALGVIDGVCDLTAVVLGGVQDLM